VRIGSPFKLGADGHGRGDFGGSPPGNRCRLEGKEYRNLIQTDAAINRGNSRDRC